MARDMRTDDALRAANWHVIRIWEHEDAAQAAEGICRVVATRRQHAGHHSGTRSDPTTAPNPTDVGPLHMPAPTTQPPPTSAEPT
jgi:DNA mismatch endonuclease (patch repair protein)